MIHQEQKPYIKKEDVLDKPIVIKITDVQDFKKKDNKQPNFLSDVYFSYNGVIHQPISIFDSNVQELIKDLSPDDKEWINKDVLLSTKAVMNKNNERVLIWNLKPLILTSERIN